MCVVLCINNVFFRQQKKNKKTFTMCFISSSKCHEIDNIFEKFFASVNCLHNKFRFSFRLPNLLLPFIIFTQKKQKKKPIRNKILIYTDSNFTFYYYKSEKRIYEYTTP